MEAQEKIKVVSIIFYTVSVIIVLIGIVFTLIRDPDSWWGTVTLYVFMVPFFILSLGTGLYIKKQRKWVRTMAITLSIVMLLSIPVGLVLGTINLVFLFDPGVKKRFK